MADITFKRTGDATKEGPILGELTIGAKTWPTVERGSAYTFVRKGEYQLVMDVKNTGRKVKCLRFDHDGIRTHLIHDALNDRHTNLSGCIAPGLKDGAKGYKDSAKAMLEVWAALGGYKKGVTKTIKIENNIMGDETAEQWIRRRKTDGKY